MRLADWLAPPRHLLLLFAAVTLVPAAALVWLGWQFFERDRVFEEQQIFQRLTATADRFSADIASRRDAAIRNLPARADLVPAPAPDALLVTLNSTELVAHSGTPLLFSPVLQIAKAGVDSVDSASSARWASAISLEFRDRDFRSAIRAYQALLTSSDAGERAMAMVATARNLRALGEWNEALAIYRTLEKESATTILGEPAELVARVATCAMLDELGKKDELAATATRLAGDLAGGRWRIDRATFEARVAELRTWVQPTINEDDAAKAMALETFWSDHLVKRASASGYRFVTAGNRHVVLIWRTTGDDLTVLAAGKEHIASNWIPVRASSTVRIAFDNPPERAIRLRSVDLGLPWDLWVTDDAVALDSAGFATRRRLLGWSLAALVVLIPAGGWVVWRAIQKDLSVARLQADFVSAVSHEFRTPLTSMAHLTERLQRDALAISDDRRREYYDVLARDTDRLRRFVETLLDFGRMEAGAGSLRTKPENLTGVVAEIVAEFRRETSAHSRDIQVESNGALPPVLIDREAFSRALWNLLENATKYSPAGSPITVGIHREPRGARVAVSDRGAGIPVNERRQIFEKFVRGEESKAAGIRGTGVGLALVERIMRAHGGEVRLDSIVGEGSTFSLVLPIDGVPES